MPWDATGTPPFKVRLADEHPLPQAEPVEIWSIASNAGAEPISSNNAHAEPALCVDTITISPDSSYLQPTDPPIPTPDWEPGAMRTFSEEAASWRFPAGIPVASVLASACAADGSMHLLAGAMGCLRMLSFSPDGSRVCVRTISRGWLPKDHQVGATLHAMRRYTNADGKTASEDESDEGFLIVHLPALSELLALSPAEPASRERKASDAEDQGHAGLADETQRGDWLVRGELMKVTIWKHPFPESEADATLGATLDKWGLLRDAFLGEAKRKECNEAHFGISLKAAAHSSRSLHGLVSNADLSRWADSASTTDTRQPAYNGVQRLARLSFSHEREELRFESVALPGSLLGMVGPLSALPVGEGEVLLRDAAQNLTLAAWPALEFDGHGGAAKPMNGPVGKVSVRHITRRALSTENVPTKTSAGALTRFQTECCPIYEEPVAESAVELQSAAVLGLIGTERVFGMQVEWARLVGSDGAVAKPALLLCHPRDESDVPTMSCWLPFLPPLTAKPTSESGGHSADGRSTSFLNTHPHSALAVDVSSSSSEVGAPPPPLLFHALPSGGRDVPPRIQLVDLKASTFRDIPLLPSAATIGATAGDGGITQLASARPGVEAIASKSEEATLPHEAMEVVHALAVPSAEGVLTIHRCGEVKLWCTATTALRRRLDDWRRLVGWQADGAAGGWSGNGLSQASPSIVQNYKSPLDATMPKHGKIDPSGNPHVGGNTWAGGTGGRDTAGLGGKGGPYRLSDGNPIHQISEEEKRNVSPEAKAAAKAMAERAFAARLAEIDMSEHEASQYEALFAPIAEQVQQIRTLLSAREARAHERVWLSRQTHGDLDDARLVDGVAGDQNVFRRRADAPPGEGAPQLRPKHISFVMDVSGSMYYFNGCAQCRQPIARLERIVACDAMPEAMVWISVCMHTTIGPLVQI
mmetsp:Transcript_2536/g.7215  ORF Transcript_2536/g.7215 Transcript_2536/m.7215 type:complete len:929 (-) Transcript_2536:1607-4393(-)